MIDKGNEQEYGAMAGSVRALLAALNRLVEENARLAGLLAQAGIASPPAEYLEAAVSLDGDNVSDAAFARMVHEPAARPSGERQAEDADENAAVAGFPAFTEVEW